MLKKNLTRGNLELLTRIRNLYGEQSEKLQSYKSLNRVARKFYKQGLLEGYIQKNPKVPESQAQPQKQKANPIIVNQKENSNE